MKYRFPLNTVSLAACAAILAVHSALPASAYEERSYLERSADTGRLAELLSEDRSWVPYPAYADRKGWNSLLGASRHDIVRRGEKYLDYGWKPVRATDYLAFERTGDRGAMQEPYNGNVRAFKALVLAELAEGQGRFMDQIANGAYFFCEMTSWALSAHLKAQKTRRSLPDDREQIIDLASGELSATLAWTHYFLKDGLDRIDPALSGRIRREIRKRTIEPYLARNFHWNTLGRPKGAAANNWNPWCNGSVLQCLLLIEDDRETLVKGVYKTMQSVDKFMDYVKSDGACEEGPSYWGHAAGELFDYLSILSMATGGRIDLFDKPLIRNMGEYIARSRVGNGWVVNFADASARGKDDPMLVFRYGLAVNSPVMIGHAAAVRDSDGVDLTGGSEMFRSLEGFRFRQALSQALPSFEHPPVSWYPETEFCYMHEPKNDWFFAAKGGHNDESHNHNDAGTFSLYVRNTPVIIDVGVGTYTAQTFGKDRYSIWTMRSDYHNLPSINGVPQKNGRSYKAAGTACDLSSRTFSCRLENAYPEEARVDSWGRTCRLDESGLTVSDRFSLKEAAVSSVFHYMTWAEPDISVPGRVMLDKQGIRVVMEYDPKSFEASAEKIELTDPPLVKVWGEAVYRLKLMEKKPQRKGEHTVKFRLP